jgi:hypothetical protein
MTSKLFTCAGITTHSRAGVTVTKIRYGTDYVRMIKMLNSNKKISVSLHPDDRGDGYLDAVRVELVELPSEMNKVDACKHLATLPEFQSAEDQLLIQEEIANRSPKTPRTPKTPKVPKVKATVGSLMSRKNKSIDTYEKLVSALA